MKTLNHSKGPWWMDTGTDGAVIHNDVTIASIPTDAMAWEANARLVSAAPELLEALENMVSCFKSNDSDSMANAVEDALSAIAKARGTDE